MCVCLSHRTAYPYLQAGRQTDQQRNVSSTPLFSLVQWPTALVPGIGQASASNDQGAMVETDWCVWDRPLPPTDIADANKVQQDSHRRRGKCTFCTNKKPRGRQPDPTEPNRTDKTTSPARVRDSPQCLRDTPTPVPADRYGSKTQTSLTMTCPPPPPLRSRSVIRARAGVDTPRRKYMFRFMVGTCARGMVHMALSAAAAAAGLVVMRRRGCSDLVRDGGSLRRTRHGYPVPSFGSLLMGCHGSGQIRLYKRIDTHAIEVQCWMTMNRNCCIIHVGWIAV